MKLHRDEEAEEYLDQILKEVEDGAGDDCPCLNFINHVAELVITKAGYLMERGQLMQALHYLDRFKPFLQKVSRKERIYYHMTLADIYDQLGRKDVAAVYDEMASASMSPLCVVRRARRMKEAGNIKAALRLLRVYEGTIVSIFHDRPEGGMHNKHIIRDTLKPLEMLRGLLHPDSHRGEVMELERLMDGIITRDEEKREQVLAEIRADAMARRSRNSSSSNNAKAGRKAKRRVKKASKASKNNQQKSAPQRQPTSSSSSSAAAAAAVARPVTTSSASATPASHPSCPLMEEERECSICLTANEEDGNGEEEEEECWESLMVCEHWYHSDCLDLWVEKNQQNGTQATCPLCREPIKRGMKKRGVS